MPRATTPQRQRGSMAVTMMLLMVWLLAALVVVEAAYLYWAKRDTQKVADLSALAGAQQLQDCAGSNADNSAARGNAATENHFSGTLTINCGTWNPSTGPSPTYFTAGAAGASTNAVMVTAKRPVTPFFPFTASLPSVQTEAVATQAPSVAAFSIASTLVNVSGNATLPQLLSSLGLNIAGTSLVGYQGLADVTITPAGLLQQLGIPTTTNLSVGQLNSLLSANTQTLGNVLNAIVTVANQQSLLSANASLVSALQAALAVNNANVSLNVPLGSSTSTPTGLFAQIVGPNGTGQAALNANVNALQLIEAAVQVASSQHAIYAYTPINLGLFTVTVATGIVEPPSIGIGGTGTKAYTSQVRLFIEIATNPSTGVSLLGGLVTLNLDIPIVINLVNAQATLADLCDPPTANPATAVINTSSSVLDMCVGNITQATAFSTSLACTSPPAKNLFSLSTLGVNLASLTSSFYASALTGTGTVTLSPGETGITGDTLNLGTSLSNLLNSVLVGVLANNATTTGSTLSSTGVTQTASGIWNATAVSGQTNLQHLNAAISQLQSTTTGLSGFLGSVGGEATSLLGNTLSLNVTGLLGNVGSLLGTVTGTLGNILNYTGCALSVGSAPSSCLSVIQSNLSSGSGSGTGTGSSEFVALVGYLLNALQGPLNQLGTQLQSTISSTLGLQIGQNTVALHSLQCHRVQLVY